MSELTESMAAEKNGKVHVDAYRERVAAAIDVEVSELIAPRRNDPRAVQSKKIAAYLLDQHDRLPLADVATILSETEQWARDSSAYIQHRINAYYALRIYVEKVIEAYVLGNLKAGKATGQTLASGIDVDAQRDRIARAVGMTPAELVALSSDEPDAETIQKVAAYLLLSRDHLSVGDVAQILGKTEQWTRSSKDYVERQVKRDSGVRSFVEEATAACGLARASAKPKAN